jgi:hypothetical protein
MKKHYERGAGLLELLMALAVCMSILPFVYDYVMNRKNKAEDVIVTKKIKVIQNALEQYVIDNKQTLLMPITENIVHVKLSDLKNIDAIKDMPVQLRIVKSKDSDGHAFVQGIVIYDAKNMSPFRTRQIAMIGGNESGFVDGKMLYGSFGTWQTPISSVDAVLNNHSILAGTKPFKSGDNYLQRLPSDNAIDATMDSDIDMGDNNITDVKNITASSTRLFDTLTTDSIEASKMTVSNRLDWDTKLDVFGDTMVMGPITSDGRNLDASQISVSGRSQFRNLSTNELIASKLYLSGLSIADSSSVPAIMSISRSLDMTKGHITAIDTFVGFSGSVTPKLVISGRIEDSSKSEFYWNVSDTTANMSDLHLTQLPKMIKDVYNAEKTGKTETEQIMGNVILNSNATVSDFTNALDTATKRVSEKYNAIKDSL